MLVIFLAGVWLTWQIQHDSRNKIFLNGIVPNPKPEGFYNGNFQEKKVSWIGKKFNSTNSTGINIFINKEGIKSESYPFVTFVGKGLSDKNLDVFKIDYNISDNPFWLRFILDEIVEVKPNEYLGKLQLRVIPGYPFAIAYFELKR